LSALFVKQQRRSSPSDPAAAEWIQHLAFKQQRGLHWTTDHPQWPTYLHSTTEHWHRHSYCGAIRQRVWEHDTITWTMY